MRLLSFACSSRLGRTPGQAGDSSRVGCPGVATRPQSASRDSARGTPRFAQVTESLLIRSGRTPTTLCSSRPPRAAVRDLAPHVQVSSADRRLPDRCSLRDPFRVYGVRRQLADLVSIACREVPPSFETTRDDVPTCCATGVRPVALSRNITRVQDSWPPI